MVTSIDWNIQFCKSKSKENVGDWKFFYVNVKCLLGAVVNILWSINWWTWRRWGKSKSGIMISCHICYPSKFNVAQSQSSSALWHICQEHESFGEDYVGFSIPQIPWARQTGPRWPYALHRQWRKKDVWLSCRALTWSPYLRRRCMERWTWWWCHEYWLHLGWYKACWPQPWRKWVLWDDWTMHWEHVKVVSPFFYVIKMFQFICC